MNFVAAILYAVSTSSLVALLVATARGGLTSGIAAAALGCGLLVLSLNLWRGRRPAASPRAPNLRNGWPSSPSHSSRCASFYGSSS
ncbi:MAG: hypothetical protein WDN28_17360 [Chthoniobacter sp.]